MSLWVWRAAVLAAVIAPVGCGGSGEEVRDDTGFTRTEYTDDGLYVIYADTDDDGLPDVAKYFEETQAEGSDEVTRTLIRTELDLTGDGSYNLTRAYNAAGDLIREEMDGNLDGLPDHYVFWENGTIMRTERDEDLNGTIDVTRYYHEGFLSRVERDRDGDSEIDMWAYYDRHGLARVGYDTTGDGAADTWTNRPEGADF